MIDLAATLARLDTERRQLAREGEIIEIHDEVTRLRAADGSHHSVIFSSLTNQSADAIILKEIEHHRQLGVEFEWKAYSLDEPSDLLSRLVHHGFSIGPREAVLGVELCQLSTWLNKTAAGAVARVDRQEQLEDFRLVAEEVFAKHYDFTIAELANALRAGSTQHRAYVAYGDGEPVAVGRLYTNPASCFGMLVGGGTRPRFRGQGLYRALIAARAADAAAAGATHLLVDALPTSRPILESLGFQWLTDTWPCEWRPLSS